jgi:hypothetical protein
MSNTEEEIKKKGLRLTDPFRTWCHDVVNDRCSHHIFVDLVPESSQESRAAAKVTEGLPPKEICEQSRTLKHDRRTSYDGLHTQPTGLRR